MTEKPRLSNAEFIAAALEQIEMADGVFSAHVTLASETLPEALGRLAAASEQVRQQSITIASVQRAIIAAEVERDQLRNNMVIMDETVKGLQAQVKDLQAVLDHAEQIAAHEGGP